MNTVSYLSRETFYQPPSKEQTYFAGQQKQSQLPPEVAQLAASVALSALLGEDGGIRQDLTPDFLQNTLSALELVVPQMPDGPAKDGVINKVLPVLREVDTRLFAAKMHQLLQVLQTPALQAAISQERRRIEGQLAQGHRELAGMLDQFAVGKRSKPEDVSGEGDQPKK